MYNKMNGSAPVDNKKIINNMYDPIVCLYLCLASKIPKKWAFGKKKLLKGKLEMSYVSEM
jgi:hypothetical protein